MINQNVKALFYVTSLRRYRYCANHCATHNHHTALVLHCLTDCRCQCTNQFFLYVFIVISFCLNTTPLLCTRVHLYRACKSRARKRGWGHLGAGGPYSPC